MTILDTLGLAPTDALALPGRLRNRFIRFLIRWEHYTAALACLDVLQEERPDLVSLYDARARALLALDRADEALNVMDNRHRWKQSLTSRIQLARVHLARGDIGTALRMAKELVAEEPDSVLAWRLLGDAHLERGDADNAEGAYRRIGEIRPETRSHAFCLAKLYRAQADYVSASAWAVRLESLATDEAPLAVYQLRWLADYYQASGETNRADDIQAALRQRSRDELAEVQTALVDALGFGYDPPHSADDVGPDGGATVRPITRGATQPQARTTPAATPLASVAAVDVEPAVLDELLAATRRHFGFEELLPGQAEVMALMQQGKDVLAVMATGGGKSLCYQLPALADEGTTLVISPLIALMKDQIDSLPSAIRNRATTINSTLAGDELGRRLHRAAAGAYRLVYAAPERLRQPPFLDALRQAGITRFVIDEAHCVSLWGHDFRPDYLFLADARRAVGNPPLLAMTATAPPRVRADVMQRLGDLEVVATDIHRPNLRLEAITTAIEDEKLAHLIRLCQAIDGPGIVYASTRAKCEELAAMLRAQDVAANHYHAGITDRAAAQDAFMQGDVRVVVATIAFGMGIDKADIRFIIHYNLARSLEAYYQEAGRAGRDGEPSRCVLFYSPSDRATLTRWARRDSLTVDFLRSVYQAVSGRLGGATAGSIATDDLMRDLTVDDTQVRVALSLLEQVGLLRRHFDAPRSAVVTLRPAGARSGADDDFRAFIGAARLATAQPVERDVIAVGRDAGLDADAIELKLLEWQRRGWLDYRSAGRDLLIERLPAPDDVRQQLDSLLDNYSAVQDQRIAEIVAYAKTRRCRHGHISAYFGGRHLDDCGACDNCRGTRSQYPRFTDMADDRQDMLTVLACVAGLRPSRGPVGLAQILRAGRRAPAGTEESDHYGALRHRSRSAIEKLISRLVDDGLLHMRRLDHGGGIVEITRAGRSALDDPTRLPITSGSGRETAELASPASGSDHAPSPGGDAVLYERLTRWRLEMARAASLPTYFIVQNGVLQQIAQHKPQTRSELGAIKGIGPKKLAQYGEAILAIVRQYTTQEGDSPVRHE